MDTTDDIKDIWEEGYFRLFISHSSDYKEIANSLKDQLRYHHISAFVAHQDINPTEEWENVIFLALKSCDALAAILTTTFHQSYWTDQEIGICIGMNKLILPLKLGIDPYGFIGKYQAFQIDRVPYQIICSNIYEIIKKNKLTEFKITEALVHAFENAFSFDNAKNLLSEIEGIKYLPEELICKIEKARESNIDISRLYPIYQTRIDALINKHRNIASDNIPF